MQLLSAGVLPPLRKKALLSIGMVKPVLLKKCSPERRWWTTLNLPTQGHQLSLASAFVGTTANEERAAGCAHLAQYGHHGNVGLAGAGGGADEQVLVAPERRAVDAALDAVERPARRGHQK